MKKYGPQLLFCLLVAAAAVTIACGSSTPRTLQSVTVSPATADAKNFPNGEVQFTATAVYNTKPSPVSPATASWGACSQGKSTTSVSVSNAGVAQCTSGASGTFTILAIVFDLNPKQPPPLMPKWDVFCGDPGALGHAQITCP
jgi:hypothetical protein